MARIIAGIPRTLPKNNTDDDDSAPRDEDAETIALKIGAAYYVWVPWPEEPSQWIAMRTCTIPEIEQAYLYACGKLKQHNRPDDMALQQRYENLALMAFACSKAMALEVGVDEATGGIKLNVISKQYDEPLFTDPEDLRIRIRDEHTLNTLVGYYRSITAQYAPLSTYARLANEKDYERLVAVLKKKPGPIDWPAFGDEVVAELMDYLLTRCV